MLRCDKFAQVCGYAETITFVQPFGLSQLLSLSVAAALSCLCFSLCILAALRSWIGLGSLPLEKRKKDASCWHRTGILVVFNHGVPGFYVDH